MACKSSISSSSALCSWRLQRTMSIYRPCTTRYGRRCMNWGNLRILFKPVGYAQDWLLYGSAKLQIFGTTTPVHSRRANAPSISPCATSSCHWISSRIPQRSNNALPLMRFCISPTVMSVVLVLKRLPRGLKLVGSYSPPLEPVCSMNSINPTIFYPQFLVRSMRHWKATTGRRSD